jgi:hypothetical protein
VSKEKPKIAEQFELGGRYSFRKPDKGLLVVGYVEGLNRESRSGELALTQVKIEGYGWIDLVDWVIEGENK